MAILDDFSVSLAGDIRYTGAAHGAAGAGYYSVIELHRYLQGLADNASVQNDDLLDITSNDPSDRSTDNIIELLGSYNIDDLASEHLYGGSISQSNGDVVYYGFVNYGDIGIRIGVIQDGEIYDNDFWNTIPDGEADEGLNRDVSKGISHQFLLKCRDAGDDIDGRKVIGLSREFGWTYSEFIITEAAYGNNIMALSNQEDPNNQTDAATVDGWAGDFSNEEKLNLIDIDGNGMTEPYYSQWKITNNARTLGDLYEYIKYITRYGATDSYYGIEGQLFRGVTHQFEVDSGSMGDFNDNELVTWNTGNGRLFASGILVEGGFIWLQVLTGELPENGDVITGADSGATATMQGSGAVERTVSTPSNGAFTGSAVIGGYGFGIDPAHLSKDDVLVDLYNDTNVPPNIVNITVSGVVATEDRILVAQANGNDILFDQYHVDGATAAGANTVKLKTNIAVDTPPAGTIRVFDGTNYIRVEYTSWYDDTFAGCTGTPDIADNANLFVSYIDKAAADAVETVAVRYLEDRNMVVRVRDGGATPIKTFNTTAKFTSNGLSVTAVRTSDA